MILDWFDKAPRRVLALVSVACFGLIAAGLVLQQVFNLEPCPMCIVQRYAFILTGVITGLGAAFKGRGAHITAAALAIVSGGFGAFVAARQSWLQWYPPETVSCGRDFYGMIENFPLKRAIPMIFRGSGDCTKVDWSFLGLSFANWAFVCFSIVIAVSITLIARQWRSRAVLTPATAAP